MNVHIFCITNNNNLSKFKKAKLTFLVYGEGGGHLRERGRVIIGPGEFYFECNNCDVELTLYLCFVLSYF